MVIKSAKVGEITRNEISSSMVGRSIEKTYTKINGNIGDIVLEVKNLNNDRLKDVNFVVRKGEILGFAGLVGAGRTEVARAIFGMDPISSGEVDAKTPVPVALSPVALHQVD